MKIIRNIAILLYAIVAIFVTICLLSYNEQRVTVFGNTYLLKIDNDSLEPEYKKGALVIVDGSRKAEVGDEIFFHNRQLEITIGEVISAREITETQTTYTVKIEGTEGEIAISSDYVIGVNDSVKNIEKLGTVMQVLESRWGFLLLVVLPAVIAFLYEIFEVFTELRGNKRNGKEPT